MPRYIIPATVEKMRVLVTMAGTYAAWDGKKGRGGLVIPCRDKAHAEEVCRRINAGEHNGEVWI